MSRSELRQVAARVLEPTDDRFQLVQRILTLLRFAWGNGIKESESTQIDNLGIPDLISIERKVLVDVAEPGSLADRDPGSLNDIAKLLLTGCHHCRTVKIGLSF